MGTERTALGKATFIILNVGFGALAFVCLIGVSGIWLPSYPSSARAFIMFFGLLIFGSLAFVIYRFWDAYRKNDPQKINTVSTVIFVIYLIFFCLYAMSFNAVKDMDISAYREVTRNIDPGRTLLGLLTSLIALGVIMAEVKIHKKGNISPTMKCAWILVLVMMAYSFVSMIFRGLFSSFSAEIIMVLGISLCLHAGIVLISCWIVNQDKFYIANNSGTKPNQNIQNTSFDQSAL